MPNPHTDSIIADGIRTIPGAENGEIFGFSGTGRFHFGSSD
jgi:hypothetical protein